MYQGSWGNSTFFQLSVISFPRMVDHYLPRIFLLCLPIKMPHMQIPLKKSIKAKNLEKENFEKQKCQCNSGKITQNMLLLHMWHSWAGGMKRRNQTGCDGRVKGRTLVVQVKVMLFPNVAIYNRNDTYPLLGEFKITFRIVSSCNCIVIKSVNTISMAKIRRQHEKLDRKFGGRRKTNLLNFWSTLFTHRYMGLSPWNKMQKLEPEVPASDMGTALTHLWSNSQVTAWESNGRWPERLEVLGLRTHVGDLKEPPKPWFQTGLTPKTVAI